MTEQRAERSWRPRVVRDPSTIDLVRAEAAARDLLVALGQPVDGAHMAETPHRMAHAYAELLTDDWTRYFAPWVDDLTPGTAHQAMLAVGVIEIVAGILVAIRPQIGGYVVALWLVGIIVDLVTLGDFYDVALRDFGLFVAAVALARLAASEHASGQGR